MGLNCTHGFWDGPYSAFMRWRIALAKAAGFPPLLLMEGFYEAPPGEAMKWAAPREGGPLCGSHLGCSLHDWIERHTAELPISWAPFKPDPLHVLLDHSDCDGKIAAKHCALLADRLAGLVKKMPAEWREKTKLAAAGAREASQAKEDIRFM
jgi:hypothetical protein